MSDPMEWNGFDPALPWICNSKLEILQLDPFQGEKPSAGHQDKGEKEKKAKKKKARGRGKLNEKKKKKGKPYSMSTRPW